MSSAACAPPTCSKAKSTAARSKSRRSSAKPSPGAPSGSAGAPSKARRACERLGSTVATVSRRAAGDEERFAGEIDRGRERHGCQRVSELLGEHAKPEMPQPGAAIFLGDRRAGPAHAGDLLPQRLVIGARAIDDAPRGAERVALAQEFARLAAQ